MISVVIPTLNDEAVLGRALQPLVAAAVAGLVREVIVADGGSSDATLEVADDAGCRILAGAGDGAARAREAAATARADWVMVLDPRAQLLPGWERAVQDHLERGSGRSALMPSLDPDGGSFLGRVMSLFGRAGPTPVLIAPRKGYAAGEPIGPTRKLAARALVLRAADD
jgi:glycosyltransferase involved in cell wall biosynthesis